MAQFSNGSEGAGYRERWCDRCVHGNREQACAVWAMHYTLDYEPNKVCLDILIPENHLSEPGQCRMFVEKHDA